MTPGSAVEVPVRDSGMSVYRLFADRAGETPDRTAVIAGPTTITYGELAERADRTARHLLDADAGPTVAVVLDQPIEVLVGVLAVLAAGRAFMVLDPATPMGELERLLARAGAGAVITREEFRPRVESPLVGCVDTDAMAVPTRSARPSEAPAGAIAAVVFSTGTRRAVEVSHARLRAAYDAWAQVYELDPADVHLVTAPPDTVAFAGGWVRALCSGATLMLPDRPDLVTGVTVLDTDPETAGALLGSSPPGSLRLVVVSGARLTLDRQARLAPGTRVLNVYGTAEVAGCGTWFEPDQLAEPEPERVSLLGRPFPGCRVDVHDGEIRLTPPGGGDPTSTGDAGFLRADGVLEFRGRLADRITMGRRTVDPYPAESALGGHPDIAEVVITAGDGNRLVAYVMPRPRATAADAADAAAVRAFLTGVVAENEIPDAVVSLPALPRDRTGKADRAALPRPPRTVAPAGGKGGGSVRSMDFAAVLRWILLPVAALFAAVALTDVFWPGATDVTAVPGPWSGLFRGLYAAEWLAFAAGVTFLVNGRPMMARQGCSRALTTVAHLAIVWLLVSWWPQDNFYRLAAKTDWPRQAALVYVFNVSLMVAGLLVAIYAARRPRAAA